MNPCSPTEEEISFSTLQRHPVDQQRPWLKSTWASLSKEWKFIARLRVYFLGLKSKRYSRHHVELEQKIESCQEGEVITR